MPENASSSQNANSTENKHLIASLEPAGKGGFFFINFNNREPLKILKSIIRDSGIFEGQILSDLRIQELFLENETELAKRTGMDILGRRPNSEKELRDKLARKGFSKAAVNRTSERFLELRLLDDLEYCKSWIRSRIYAKRSSRNEILGKLITKGVGRDIAK
ncbi:MAG: regulatory protein RecX, partial [Spirochaetaceae bacterium]